MMRRPESFVSDETILALARLTVRIFWELDRYEVGYLMEPSSRYYG